MPTIGYFLSCEQYGPKELVAQARAAQDAGFERLWISDHFHPWNDEQGESPFVWSVIGALSEAVDLPITTAVTCPTIRIHPAVVAQAAATAAVQLDGRFVLGVGSGEALNEHVLGDPWPDVSDEALLADPGRWWSGPLTTARSRADLAKIDAAPILRGLLDPRVAGRLDELAPERIALPSGRRFAVDYSTDPPVLAVKLQELLGVTTTPTIAVRSRTRACAWAFGT